jgi:hypothetical protein
MIHHGGNGGVHIQGGIIIQNLVPIGVGSVLNKALNGKHGVCGDGILSGGCAVGCAGTGVGHQSGDSIGLYAEVGSVSSAASQVCIDSGDGLGVDTYEG